MPIFAIFKPFLTHKHKQKYLCGLTRASVTLDSKKSRITALKIFRGLIGAPRGPIFSKIDKFSQKIKDFVSKLLFLAIFMFFDDNTYNNMYCAYYM